MSVHVHRPVYPADMPHQNAYCETCGYFPLPLTYARPSRESMKRLAARQRSVVRESRERAATLLEEAMG